MNATEVLSDTPVAVPTVPVAARPAHDHAWTTQSRHASSDGWVRYVRCACGARRVDLSVDPHLPATALSRTLP